MFFSVLLAALKVHTDSFVHLSIARVWRQDKEKITNLVGSERHLSSTYNHLRRRGIYVSGNSYSNHYQPLTEDVPSPSICRFPHMLLPLQQGS